MEEPKSRSLLLCALGCTCVAWTVFSYLCDVPLGYGREMGRHTMRSSLLLMRQERMLSSFKSRRLLSQRQNARKHILATSYMLL